MADVIKSVCIIIVTLTCCHSKNLPSFIKKCKLTYPEVNKCLVQCVNDLKPYLEKGIPEMKIPSIKPLRIPKAEIHTGNGFNADFTDIVITGAENFETKKIDFNLDNHNAVMQIYIPKIRIQSTYNFNGKILILELSGSGPADANITNINSKVQTGIKKVNRNGKEYIDVEDQLPVISFDKPTLLFDDLFKGNEELTKHTNQVINDNIEEIGKEIKPLIDDTIHQFVYGIIKQVFDEYTVDELFD